MNNYQQEPEQQQQQEQQQIGKLETLATTERVRILDYRMRAMLLHVVNSSIAARVESDTRQRGGRKIYAKCEPMRYSKIICTAPGCFDEIEPMSNVYNKKKNSHSKCFMHVECARSCNYL